MLENHAVALKFVNASRAKALPVNPAPLQERAGAVPPAFESGSYVSAPLFSRRIRVDLREEFEYLHKTRFSQKEIDTTPFCCRNGWKNEVKAGWFIIEEGPRVSQTGEHLSALVEATRSAVWVSV